MNLPTPLIKRSIATALLTIRAALAGLCAVAPKPAAQPGRPYEPAAT